MTPKRLSQNALRLWQSMFLLLGTTWLLAPRLNHTLSYRVSLISQYETPGQPYAWLFRLCDIGAAALLLWLVVRCIDRRTQPVYFWLLLMVGGGMLLDPILTTTCRMQGSVCTETVSAAFFLHAAESVLTAGALLAVSLYDARRRQRLVTLYFVIFQILYGLLFVSQFAKQQRFNTVSQFLYQCIVILWLAWFCRDYLQPVVDTPQASGRRTLMVRYGVAAWALVNGILALLLSLMHIRLFGRIGGLYFAGNNAWLAQHGVVIGVVLLYLSRHLLRGEARARQIFLIIAGLEVIKYAVVTPHALLLLIYALTFCALFVIPDEFRRGTVAMTWQVRLKDLAYFAGALGLTLLLAAGILTRNNRVALVTRHAFNNFTKYALHSDAFAHSGHLRSVLLADTVTTFIAVSVGAMLWMLFRPYKATELEAYDHARVQAALQRHSNSSEDFFKSWPQDKQYFWSADGHGFIAYKAVGPVAYALADPIIADAHRAQLIEQFVNHARRHRLRACFLPVAQTSLKYYDFDKVQIGASAVIDTHTFTTKTSKDKWWRWKQNRATKQGYTYTHAQPPHTMDFINKLSIVSDSWLAQGGHQERGLAMGYFDPTYLNQCTIHYLTDQAGQIVAFANQVPIYHHAQTATIDLLRFVPDASDAMPYLLAQTIQALTSDYRYFDLGFVPFAATKGSIQTIARSLSASRFSAKGLEQFKNKFDPDWQANYLVYDGDLADLALIALNMEKAMEATI